ncbi:TlpA family protein disulfide reductase [Massilia pinisoli]|uniref:TlpA family protein disulfide reductase n=1 Tax=Massilia pinisoli TaxID=1772194 RepID=A0ABT1ZNH3_9BURK|nr:TlpA disulfide reductase family protein [Massilia pinisoli]MCS0581450.1 TlpA family protein disulfide reductase [Massilia pinisoli]
MRLRSLFPRTCAALLLSVSTLAWAGAPAAGDMAPDDLGMTLSGKPVHVKDYAGKAVVISFWASWCKYCLKELPILFNIQKAAKGNLQVVAINTEDDEIFQKLSRAMRTLEIGMSYDPDETARAAYGVNGIPHLVVIGRDGKIVEVFRGYGESSLTPIVAAINKALAAQ